MGTRATGSHFLLSLQFLMLATYQSLGSLLGHPTVDGACELLAIASEWISNAPKVSEKPKRRTAMVQGWK